MGTVNYNSRIKQRWLQVINEAWEGQEREENPRKYGKHKVGKRIKSEKSRTRKFY